MFPRRDQLFRIGAAELLDTNDELALSSVLRPGHDANLLMNGCAAMGEEVVSQLGGVAAGTYLDSATGAKLRQRAWDRHRIVAKPAAPSYVDVTFSIPTPATLGFTIPGNTQIKAADGKQYMTVSDLPFAVGAASGSVRARSTLAGTSQAVRPGVLTSIVSTITGAPQGLAVTNPLASSEGADAESEDDLKSRCRLEPRSRVRGTAEAIQFAALSVPGVLRATPFAGIDSMGRANRIAGVVLAGQFTDTLVRQGVSSTVYESQSHALARVVELEGLSEYRAFGIHVSAFVAQVIMVALRLRLRFVGSLNIDYELVKLEAASVAVQTLNTSPPGRDFDPQSIVAKLRSVRGLDVRGDEVEAPAGPVVATSPYMCFRTNLEAIQFSTSAQLSAASFSVITP